MAKRAQCVKTHTYRQIKLGGAAVLPDCDSRDSDLYYMVSLGSQGVMCWACVPATLAVGHSLDSHSATLLLHKRLTVHYIVFCLQLTPFIASCPGETYFYLPAVQSLKNAHYSCQMTWCTGDWTIHL